jgi:uncharacterized membrane protein YcaP (DUF421 family)
MISYVSHYYDILHFTLLYLTFHIIMISYISLPCCALRAMVDGERFSVIRAGDGAETSGHLWIIAFTRISQDTIQS